MSANNTLNLAIHHADGRLVPRIQVINQRFVDAIIKPQNLSSLARFTKTGQYNFPLRPWGDGVQAFGINEIYRRLHWSRGQGGIRQ